MTSSHFLNLLAASQVNLSPLFAVFAVILIFAVLVALLLAKAKQSLLAGYFICGVILANSGIFNYLLPEGNASENIQIMADIGVVLLMFTLGIEFPIKDIKYIWRSTFLGGFLQVSITSALFLGIGLIMGISTPIAMVTAVALALSSTAVSLKSFQDLGLSSHPGARFSLSLAIFQDIFVILFTILLPSILIPGERSILPTISISLLKGIVFMAGSGFIGIYIIPKLLDAVAKTRSRELFTLTVIGLCASIAYIGDAMNLGLALGAFSAGLIVSGSIYSHRILSDILPFKDLFLTIFFVSVGLMIDLEIAIAHWPTIILGVLLILTIKSCVVFAIGKSLKIPVGASILSALSLASSGEFSIILLAQANQSAPFPEEMMQIALICTGVSMGIIPTLMRLYSPLLKYLKKRGIYKQQSLIRGRLSSSEKLKNLEDHAIIFGYGPVGQALHKTLLQHQLPTLIIDINAETVRALHKANHPVLFADATHHEFLELARIQHARFLAYTFPNVSDTITSIKMVRQHHPEACIFARAKFSSEVEALENLCVQTVHDERESSFAMVQLGLSAYLDVEENNE